jgi:predicted dehydrogenase
VSKTKVKLGVIGCGKISGIYLENCLKFDNLEVRACADLDLKRAKSRAAEYSIPKAYSVEELLHDPEIELVLNLTVPMAHAAVGMAALEAGKAVYNEKPLAVNLAEAQELLLLAQAKGLGVGCAPDTFLGGGLQTCLQLIEEGAIGRPVAATAFMLNHGHESWHPDPDFYFQPGGGPMFDMGPYYLTALVNLLGPVRRVTGSAQISFRERLITSQPKAGTKIKVNTPTHITGVLDFESGVSGTIITSFDVWGHHLPRLEIYGTEGSLSLPDPNTFGGPVLLQKGQDKNWVEIPVTRPYTKDSRGLGVAEMARAMRSSEAHRPNADIGFHVLEIMEAIQTASLKGQHIELKSSCSGSVRI